MRDEQAAEVGKVLEEIEAEAIPQLVVMNKIDLMVHKNATADVQPRVERDQYGRISRVLLSARTGAGLEQLRGAIAELARERAAERAPTAQAHSLHSH